MTLDSAPAPADEEAAKDDQVLEREGLEEQLMDEDRSEVGERISDVDVNLEGED